MKKIFLILFLLVSSIVSATGSLIFSSGAVDCTAGNSTKTITLSSAITISPGRYYISFTADNTLVNIFGWTVGAQGAIIATMENVTTNHVGICANPSVAGVLPTSCGTISSNNTSIFPAIWVE